MLSPYNRNITQTEIYLHNTFCLNRIFTGGKKKKKNQKTAITHNARTEFLPVWVHVGRCRTSLPFRRAFLQRLGQEGCEVSFRSHRTPEDRHRGHCWLRGCVQLGHQPTIAAWARSPPTRTPTHDFCPPLPSISGTPLEKVNFLPSAISYNVAILAQ